MASIAPREWTNKGGSVTKKWALRWTDGEGRHRSKQFDLKRDAESWRNDLYGGVTGGTNRTVLALARNYLADFETLVDSGDREWATYRMYRSHVERHIAEAPIARTKLSDLDGPRCKEFAEWLEQNRNEKMRKNVWARFKALLDRGVAIGWLKHNMAKSIKVRGSDHRGDEDDLVDIPPKEWIRTLIETAGCYDNTGRASAFVHVLLFPALRISELRGLRLPWVELGRNTGIKVRERADEAGKLGKCKSKAAIRDVPIGPSTVTAIKRWKLACPKSDEHLLFPNGAGNVESYANFWNRLWVPLMKEAGLANVELEEAKEGEEPKETVRPWFTPHALRHAGISLWIEEAGLTPKQVQKRAGHASITTTMNIYGHLWRNHDEENSAALASERSILG